MGTVLSLSRDLNRRMLEPLLLLDVLQGVLSHTGNQGAPLRMPAVGRVILASSDQLHLHGAGNLDMQLSASADCRTVILWNQRQAG